MGFLIYKRLQPAIFIHIVVEILSGDIHIIHMTGDVVYEEIELLVNEDLTPCGKVCFNRSISTLFFIFYTHILMIIITVTSIDSAGYSHCTHGILLLKFPI